MWVSDIRLDILRALRYGPLDHYQVAADLSQAAFRVRAELKGLKTDRLVVERIAPDAHTWRLTSKGEQIAWRANQLEMR